jgi:hypothetical protein
MLIRRRLYDIPHDGAPEQQCPSTTPPAYLPPFQIANQLAHLPPIRTPKRRRVGQQQHIIQRFHQRPHPRRGESVTRPAVTRPPVTRDV